MKTITARRRYLVITALLGTLVLAGMRCNGATPGQPATTTIPTYTQKTVYDQVIWPATSTINQAALMTIPATEREKIKLSGVPVLVPGDKKYLEAVTIAEPDEYGYLLGLDHRIDGVTINILASRVATMSDAPVPARLYEPDPDGLPLRGTIVSFSQNENGNWSASWSENGQPAYLISIYCTDRADPRCADRSYLAHIVQNLVFVGGNFVPYEMTVSDK